MQTRKLSITALAIALVAVVTFFLKLPLPASQGYFNLGEAAIYLIAFLFGGPIAALAGGLGAALADLLGGYSFYAPISLVVKGLEGWAVGTLARSGKFRAVAVGAVIIMLGYGTASYFLTRNIVAVLWELGIALLQAGFGFAIAAPLARLLRPAVGGEGK